MKKTPLYHTNKESQIPLCVEKQKYKTVGESLQIAPQRPVMTVTFANYCPVKVDIN